MASAMNDDTQDSFDEGEESFLCQKLLYVQPSSRLIDLNTVPADGNEFIHKSRLEDAQLRFAEISIESQSSSEKGKKKKKGKKPTYRKGAAEFSQHANRLKSRREIIKTNLPQSAIIPVDNQKECCIFCLGSVKCEQIYGESPVANTDAHLPYVNYLIHLDQMAIQQLLRYTFKWYKTIGMDEDLGRWVYALFALTNKPLTDKLENFLEKFYDDCKTYSKKCNGEELRRVCVIMAILENYFCVKDNDYMAYFG